MGGLIRCSLDCEEEGVEKGALWGKGEDKGEDKGKEIVCSRMYELLLQGCV